MPLCQPCDAMQTGKRHAPGHEALKLTGKDYDYAPHAQAVVKVAEYQCQTCGTLWRYENNKYDDFAGWSIGQ